MTRPILFFLVMMLAAACTPEPTAVAYSPNASDSHGRVTVTVLDVIPRNQSTAVRLRIAWPDSNWDFYWTILEQGPIIRDNSGNEYETLTEAPAGDALVEVTRVIVNPNQTATPNPAGDADEKVFTFAPLPDTADTLTLQIDALEFVAEASDNFTVDLGPTPQIGQSWPLDVTLDAAGFPVRIMAVHLIEPEDPIFADRTARYRLVFDLEVEQQPDRRLDTLLLDVAGPHASESSRYTLGKLRPPVTVETLPDSPFTVTLDQAGILVPGPWIITWSAPET